MRLRPPATADPRRSLSRPTPSPPRVPSARSCRDHSPVRPIKRGRYEACRRPEKLPAARFRTPGKSGALLRVPSDLNGSSSRRVERIDRESVRRVVSNMPPPAKRPPLRRKEPLLTNPVSDLRFARPDRPIWAKKIARREPGDKPYGARLYVQFLAGGNWRIFQSRLNASVYFCLIWYFSHSILAEQIALFFTPKKTPFRVKMPVFKLLSHSFLMRVKN